MYDVDMLVTQTSKAPSGDQILELDPWRNEKYSHIVDGCPCKFAKEAEVRFNQNMEQIFSPRLHAFIVRWVA